MASNVDFYIDGYRNGGAQIGKRPFSDAWFHYRFACFGGVANESGIAAIVINSDGQWIGTENYVGPEIVQKILSTLVDLQPLGRSETLCSREGRHDEIVLRIRKDAGVGNVSSKIFEALGPSIPNAHSLRSLVFDLLEVLGDALKPLGEIRTFVLESAP